MGGTAPGLTEMTSRLVLLQGSGRKGSSLRADKFMFCWREEVSGNRVCEEKGEDGSWADGEHF